MTDIDARIHKITLVSDAAAPELVASLLRVVSRMISNQKDEEFFKNAADFIAECVPCWGETLNSLSLAFSESDIFPEQADMALGKLWKIAEFRKERLRKISLSIMPDAMPHVYSISNLDKNQMRMQLHSFATDLSVSLQLPATLDITQVEQCVHTLHQAIDHQDSGYSNEKLCAVKNALEAFLGVALQYYAEQSDAKFLQQKVEYACAGFVYCHKCWRLLPQELFGDGVLPLCDEHDYAAKTQGSYTRYKKAAQVKKELEMDSLFIPQRVSQILREFKQVWRVHYGNTSPEIWNRAFMHGFEELLGSVYEAIQYDLAPVWKICPHVQQYIIDNNGNIESPESIVSILDPFTMYELQNSFTKPREQLHNALALNFSYYRLELATAEAWLEYYNQQNREKKHGGARKNSGGKRPGAGRPRKKTMSLD